MGYSGRRTLENPDSGGEVVDTPGGTESGGDDGRRGDEIVGEAVVQVTLCNCQPFALARSSLRAHPSSSGDAGAGRGVVVVGRT